MSSLTDDDLLGGPTAPTSLEDSPAREQIAALRAAAVGRCFVDAGKLMLPVNRNFLALVFQMKPATVKNRLLHCPTLGTGTARNQDLYDFKTAVAYLVPPKMDVEQYIRSLDVAKLPPVINKIFWEGLRQRLRYMQEAGDAWATEDVLDVLGLVGMTIKSRLQLWTETLRERGKLTDEQLGMLGVMVEELQNDLARDLTLVARDGRTVPVSEKPIGDAVVEVSDD